MPFAFHWVPARHSADAEERLSRACPAIRPRARLPMAETGVVPPWPRLGTRPWRKRPFWRPAFPGTSRVCGVEVCSGDGRGGSHMSLGRLRGSMASQ
jgi:hypothetical protein